MKRTHFSSGLCRHPATARNDDDSVQNGNASATPAIPPSATPPQMQIPAGAATPASIAPPQPQISMEVPYMYQQNQLLQAEIPLMRQEIRQLQTAVSHLLQQIWLLQTERTHLRQLPVTPPSADSQMNSTPPERPREIPAGTPDQRALNHAVGRVRGAVSNEMPDWLNRVSRSSDGTYDIAVHSNNPRIAEIGTVLRHYSCIRNLSFNIESSIHGCPVPGFREVCEGIKNNQGLQTLAVISSVAEKIDNPDVLLPICEVARTHSTLKDLTIGLNLFVSGAALNNELNHPSSNLTKLYIPLPECQQEFDAFAAALGNNKTLASLGIQFTSRTAPNDDRLVQALRRHPALKKLAIKLVRHFPSNRIAALDIWSTSRSPDTFIFGLHLQINDHQAVALADFLSRSERVTQLMLLHTQLSADSAARVAASVERNLSIIDGRILSYLPEKNGGTLVKVADTPLARTIEQTARRNARLKPLEVIAPAGRALASMMQIIHAANTNQPVLPPNVGALIAEAATLTLAPEDAQNVFEAMLHIEQPTLRTRPTQVSTAHQVSIANSTH